MPVISRLPQSVINKIAAGEVIERPGSVVKELVENAIDAGATRIDVSLEAGGVELVRVVDNGCGMSAEDLPLAVASHATSKIASAEDLFRVRTLGFRGEALASIAEVSRLSIRSRPADSPTGAMIEVEGGQVSPVKPCGSPVGTAVEVRNLFFNTPVRRKFLRAAQTELGHATEALVRVALAFPGIHCTLRHQERLVFDLPPSGQYLERIGRIFGQSLAENLFWVESADGPVRLWGYVAHPSHSRSNNRMQYLFLNGRCIRDRSLQHALGEAYRGLLMTGRYPIAFLFLEMPPEWVDVNVHPTKLEVRFQDSGRLYSQLLGTLRSKFLSTDLTARLDTSSSGAAWGGEFRGDPAAALDMAASGGFQQRLVEWAKGKIAAWELPPEMTAGAQPDPTAGPEGLPTPSPAELPNQFPNPLQSAQRQRAELELVELDRNWDPVGRPEDEEVEPGEVALAGPPESGGHPLSAGPGGAGGQAPAPTVSLSGVPTPGPPAPGLPTPGFAGPGSPLHPGTPVGGWPQRPAPGSQSPGDSVLAGPQASENLLPPKALQIHNRYLVAETEEGVMVIDQHALHERILYEQLRTRVLAGPIEGQALLVPEPVDLTPAEAATVLEHRDLLARLGLRVEPFGGSTVLLSTYPAMLANIRPAELLHEAVHRLMSGSKGLEPRDLLDELLHTIACKAAIKAGDRLSAEEIAALLAQRHLIDDAHHCPHGRPTALVLRREELDRQFGRTS